MFDVYKNKEGLDYHLFAQGCLEGRIEGVNEGVNLVSYYCSHKQYTTCATHGHVDHYNGLRWVGLVSFYPHFVIISFLYFLMNECGLACGDEKNTDPVLGVGYIEGE